MRAFSGTAAYAPYDEHLYNGYCAGKPDRLPDTNWQLQLQERVSSSDAGTTKRAARTNEDKDFICTH